LGAPPEEQPTRTRDLLSRYLTGDRAAECRLFEAQRALLLQRAREHPLMRALSLHLAPEDLVGECLVRALDSRVLESFEDRGPGSLRNLLFAILDNVMKDAWRRRKAAKRGGRLGPGVSLDAGVEGRGLSLGPGALASEETTPTGAARARELLDLCKAVLSPAEWEVWRLAEVEGLDSAEVAKRIGSTAGSVRSKVRRIRGKLIARIASRGESSRPDPP